jgi:hypothetical protein
MKGGGVCSERQEEAGTRVLARGALERPAGTCLISASLSCFRCPQAAHSTVCTRARESRCHEGQGGLQSLYSLSHWCPVFYSNSYIVWCVQEAGRSDWPIPVTHSLHLLPGDMRGTQLLTGGWICGTGWVGW